MEINRTVETDVLVIGAGLAGVTAAIAAGQAGASAALVSAGRTFSGASFYPGTWGFGLIAPENDADADDLAATIRRVGMGMAQPALVDTFVGRIQRSVDALERCGVPLKRPEQKDQREFIPCFDHKNRAWYGIVQAGAKAALDKKLTGYAVARFPQTELLRLFKNDGRVCGALGVSADGFTLFRCKSCVIASGGLGGLYSHALCTGDVSGTGQFLALTAGARLVNLEFNQMMPGFVSPCNKTIYNEKVFRYSRFYSAASGESIFAGLSPGEEQRLLELRSGHGPFTSRLDSKEVDFRIFRHFQEGGVVLRYRDELRENRSEFVTTYFDWLKREKGLTIDDPVRLGIFYHASNGGIAIDRDAFTGVAGLFACGEATGGMHGADRLGGLSTANGLVFGEIAGRSAADDASAQRKLLPLPPEAAQPLLFAADAQPALGNLRRVNFGAAMIFRSREASVNARRVLSTMRGSLKSETFGASLSPTALSRVVSGYRLTAGLSLSEALHTAIGLREESRGSHYRQDFPQTDARLERRIEIYADEAGAVHTAFAGESN